MIRIHAFGRMGFIGEGRLQPPNVLGFAAHHMCFEVGVSLSM